MGSRAWRRWFPACSASTWPRSRVFDLRLSAEQLPAALTRGLAASYLVSGDEPLLVGEAADAIRAAARAAGYADRRVFFIDRSFSWDELHHTSRSLSLFAEQIGRASCRERV